MFSCPGRSWKTEELIINLLVPVLEFWVQSPGVQADDILKTTSDRQALKNVYFSCTPFLRNSIQRRSKLRKMIWDSRNGRSHRRESHWESSNSPRCVEGAQVRGAGQEHRRLQRGYCQRNKQTKKIDTLPNVFVYLRGIL